MCGIAGILTHNTSWGESPDQIVTRLADAIHHRGPDARGAHVNESMIALNCRLAIVDIAGGEQPIYNSDSSIGIVFNGEIYNYLEWRNWLLAQGAILKTNSDTEVILKLYEAMGVESFSKLDGMFAFCIWDNRTNEVFVTRDRFGMKPFYYHYEAGKKLAFGSEIRIFKSAFGMDLPFSVSGIQDYVTFRYFAGTETIYEGVKRLQPGSYLRWNGGHATLHSFSDLAEPVEKTIVDFDEAKGRLRTLLRESVQRHLIGEAPIATLLSGGVDSSIIALTLKELGVRVEAFNVGFPQLNEFKYSSIVAKSCDLKLHNIEIGTEDLIHHSDKIIRALDEPLADPACWPLYLMCEHIRPFAKVVLSGEGADELFGGYPQYEYTMLYADQSKIMDYFFEQSYYFAENDVYLRQPHLKSAWRRFQKNLTGTTSLKKMMRYDFKTWLPENLMMKGDKILMSQSLEGRFPFLASDIFAFSSSIPDHFKITPNGIKKHILKEAFGDVLPREIIERPKMGFSVPIADILRALRDEYYLTLSHAEVHEEGSILNVAMIRENLDTFYADSTTTDNALLLWTFYVLLRWMYLSRQPAVKHLKSERPTGRLYTIEPARQLA